MRVSAGALCMEGAAASAVQRAARSVASLCRREATLARSP